MDAPNWVRYRTDCIEETLARDAFKEGSLVVVHVRRRRTNNNVDWSASPPDVIQADTLLTVRHKVGVLFSKRT